MTRQTPSAMKVSELPLLRFPTDPDWPIPDEEACLTLWDKYAMPGHIRNHSRLVAELALAVAGEFHRQGLPVSLPLVRAAGLLHDLGKIYAINHGGSHAQLGSAWVMAETRNPAIARAVLSHVRWAWSIDVTDDELLPVFCLIYADKRVMHDAVVSLETRYADLRDRYGFTEAALRSLAKAHEQATTIEAGLSDRLGMDLNAYTLDSRGLVPGA